MKFKVGDKVKALCGWPHFQNAVGTIIYVNPKNRLGVYTVLFNTTYAFNITHTYDEDTLEPYYDTHSILQEIIDE